MYALNKLLHKDTKFNWNKDVKIAFQSNNCLAHYDSNLPLIVAADASTYGIGAILSQLHPDGTERVLQYAWETLKDTQRKYSQIDKEAYAIIFAIKKFHQYLRSRIYSATSSNIFT